MAIATPRGPLGRRLAAAALGLGLLGASPAALAAEQLVFVSGAFRRSIPVADMEHLAQTGEARGLLADVMSFGRQKPAEVSKLLKQELSLPIVFTSRLLSTRIGEAILTRVATIVFPLKAKAAGVPALKAGVINGLAQGNGTLTAVGFLKAYPNDEIEVSIPALLQIMGKATSISELVKFFSDSPLDGLRGDEAEKPAKNAS